VKTSRRLFRNFVFLFSANVLGQIFYLGGLVYLARTFSPALFGIWNLAQAWMMYLFRGGEMGLEIIGIRAIASSASSEARPIVWSIVVVRFVLGIILVAVIVAACLAGAFPAESRSLIVLLALAVFPTGATLEWLFEAHQSVGIVSAARILKGALFGLLVLLVIRDESQILDAGWLYVLSLTVAACVATVAAFRRFELLPLTFSWEKAKELLRHAVPVGVAQILSQYTLFLGTILAGYMVSGEMLGFYSAGHRLVIFLWAYGIVTSNRVILPQLSRLFESDTATFAEFVQKYLRVLAVVSLPIGIIGVGGGEGIITLLYGTRYVQSVPVFQVLCLALVIAMIRSVLEVGLIASRRQDLYVKGMVWAAVLYSVFTFAGLHFWGIQGAAWAAVGAEACYAFYLMLVFHFVKIGEMLRVIWKPLTIFGGVLAALLLFDVRNLILAVLLGGGAYIALLAATGELTRNDFHLLADLVGRERGA
jgi:O-antigen/teichoic acid export membrane protein